MVLNYFIVGVLRLNIGRSLPNSRKQDPVDPVSYNNLCNGISYGKPPLQMHSRLRNLHKQSTSNSFFFWVLLVIFGVGVVLICVIRQPTQKMEPEELNRGYPIENRVSYNHIFPCNVSKDILLYMLLRQNTLLGFLWLVGAQLWELREIFCLWW